MPRAPRPLRRVLPLLGLDLMLALTLALLAPGAAPAGQSRHGTHRARSHTSIAHGTCVLKRRKGSPRRSARHRKCAQGHTVRSGAALAKRTPSRARTKRTPRASGPTASPEPPAAPSPGAPPSPPAATSPPSEGAGAPLLPSGGVETDPIDPRYLTATPFGTSSFWIQPWRAYLDTWPASRLIESLGINFDVHPAQAEGTAQLLQDSGFKLARIGINWDSLSYEDPTQFVNEADIRTRLTALQRHGLRPLILLDANSTGPAPAKRVTLTTLSAAPAGAQSVTLSPASAAQVVAGKTGFDGLSFGGDPDILITSVRPGGLATLSRPLLHPLAAGEHRGATLLYAPFAAPTLPNGQPNPAFQETLAGWLSYVATVCREAASIFGPGGYDLEVWNELTFDSQFLNSEHYDSSTGTGSEEGEESTAGGEGTAGEEGATGEEGVQAEEGSKALESAETETDPEAEAPAPAPSKAQVTKAVVKALLAETVAYVRNPANGISPGVGISDGFADQTPFPSGAQAPLGLTALSKHLYNGPRSFPADYHERSIRPLNALGERDTLPKTSRPCSCPTSSRCSPSTT